MLIEGLVGVVAMIAAASLPTRDYYAMNTQLAKVPEYHDRILQVGGGGGVEHIGQYEDLTKESLRGRAGGAVTLAVGMAHIFDQAIGKLSSAGEQALQSMWKYWYHFAIMFEALFILTTIDAGTRIGRFLVQEVGGKLHPTLGRPDWWPGTLISTLLIVFGWAALIESNNFDTIWQMFGIANQMLAVIALAIVTVCIVNEGRGRYAWVTVVPMAVVLTTTTCAGVAKLAALNQSTPTFNTRLQTALILAMLLCTGIIVVSALVRIFRTGSRTPRGLAVELAR
jgi:carbon starvation protein